MFKAIYLKEQGEPRAELRSLDEAELPQGEVEVRVAYSTLDCKDALAVTGYSPVIRKWPAVPGIDLAGVVEKRQSPSWQPGDEVVVTGWGLGEHHWGGLAQKARLPAAWLLGLPAPWRSARQDSPRR